MIEVGVVGDHPVVRDHPVVGDQPYIFYYWMLLLCCYGVLTLVPAFPHPPLSGMLSGLIDQPTCSDAT